MAEPLTPFAKLTNALQTARIRCTFIHAPGWGVGEAELQEFPSGAVATAGTDAGPTGPSNNTPSPSKDPKGGGSESAEVGTGIGFFGCNIMQSSRIQSSSI